MLEECLLIAEKYKGKEHPSSVTHLLNLAASYSRSKNFVEAEHLLRTSLEIMRKTVGPDDQSISFPMLHLAVTLYHLKQNEEAEQLALEVLRIRKRHLEKILFLLVSLFSYFLLTVKNTSDFLYYPLHLCWIWSSLLHVHLSWPWPRI